MDRTAYWNDIAWYDLRTAEHMLATGRYLYVVFLCQQAIEKMLKALYVAQFPDEPPRSHNLLGLAKRLDMTLEDSHAQLLTNLSAYYIECRYPNYKEKLSRLTKKKEAAGYLRASKEFAQWLHSPKKF